MLLGIPVTAVASSHPMCPPMAHFLLQARTVPLPDRGTPCSWSSWATKPRVSSTRRSCLLTLSCPACRRAGSQSALVSCGPDRTPPPTRASSCFPSFVLQA